MRQVLDLSDWDRSTWVHLTGQSGHAYSSHYVDQVDAWTNGTTYPWPFGVKAVRAATTDTLILKAG
jgi:penicillin amidase